MVNKKSTKQIFYCKKCKTFQIIPKNINNPKLKDIISVYCPVCINKTKMYLIEVEDGK